MKLISNFDFKEQIEAAVAQQVMGILARFLPADLDEVMWVLKYYGINFRVDFTRGGQDCSVSRVNIKTDGKRTVKSLYVG